MFRPKYLRDSKGTVFESVFIPQKRGQNIIVEPMTGGEMNQKGFNMRRKMESIGANMKAG